MQAPLLSDEIVDIARAIMLSHTMLTKGLRYSFVASYLDNGSKTFQKLYNKHQYYGTVFLLRVSMLIVVTVSLPWLYANSIMPYPCKPEHARFAGEVGTFTRVGCRAHDLMKSPFSLMLAPIVFTFRAALTPVLGLIKRFRSRRAYQMMSVFYSLEDFVANKIWKLRYHKFPAVFGWTAQIYDLILFEMMIVSILLGSGIAMIVGMACAQIFLVVVNVVLAPSPEVISLIDGKLEAWTSDVASSQFLMRLSKVTHGSCFVTAGDLNALRQASRGSLSGLFADVRANSLSVFRFRGNGIMKETFFWEQSTLTAVFFPTEGLLVHWNGVQSDGASSDEGSNEDGLTAMCSCCC